MDLGDDFAPVTGGAAAPRLVVLVVATPAGGGGIHRGEGHFGSVTGRAAERGMASVRKRRPAGHAGAVPRRRWRDARSWCRAGWLVHGTASQPCLATTVWWQTWQPRGGSNVSREPDLLRWQVRQASLSCRECGNVSRPACLGACIPGPGGCLAAARRLKGHVGDRHCLGAHLGADHPDSGDGRHHQNHGGDRPSRPAGVKQRRPRQATPCRDRRSIRSTRIDSLARARLTSGKLQRPGVQHDLLGPRRHLQLAAPERRLDLGQHRFGRGRAGSHRSSPGDRRSTTAAAPGRGTGCVPPATRRDGWPAPRPASGR